MKNLALIVILVFSCSNPFLAQNNKSKDQSSRMLDIGLYDFTENAKAAKYYNSAYKASKKQKLKKAISLYKKAITEDPTFVEAYDNLGICYRLNWELDSAEKYYRKSIELYPEGTMAIMNLAVVFEKRKLYQEAIEYYELLKKVTPQNPEAYYGCSRMYLNLKDYQKAIDNGLQAELYYEKQGSGYIQDAYFINGLAYYYLEEFEKAKQYIQKAKERGVHPPEWLAKDLEID